MAFGLAPFDPSREIDRLERMMRRGWERGFGRLGEGLTPAVEVTDEGDHYRVRCELPGVPEDAVELTLTGNVLSIRGEKKLEKSKVVEEGKEEGAEGRPLYSEVFYGTFERVLTLPDDIDTDKVEANSNNGVFTITVGKKTEGRAKKIEVSRGH